MAFLEEDGTGLAGATSYSSVADADAWHVDHGNSATWSGATTGEKEGALILATAHVDGLYGALFVGSRNTRTQGLEWPRNYACDRDGLSISSTEVPSELPDAVAYLALKSLEGDTLDPDLSAGDVGIAAESAGVGPVRESITYAGTKSPYKAYPTASRILARILEPAGSVERG